MKPAIHVSVDRLHELLDYDQYTGLFTWLVYRNWKATEGSRAGSINPDGYVSMTIDGYSNLLGHRIAWAWMSGSWPEGLVDHKDGNRANNIWKNLRGATHIQNTQNRHAVVGASGLLGVRLLYGKWHARIRHEGSLIELGSFDSPEKASAAYGEAKRDLHPFSVAHADL